MNGDLVRVKELIDKNHKLIFLDDGGAVKRWPRPKGPARMMLASGKTC
jgi:hypothetical protein